MEVLGIPPLRSCSCWLCRSSWLTLSVVWVLLLFSDRLSIASASQSSTDPTNRPKCSAMMESGARRARPMSANLASGVHSGGPAAFRGHTVQPEFAPSDSEEEDDGFIHDDEEEENDSKDEFEADEQQHDAFRAQLERVMAQPAAVAVARFRPASAPPVRAKPANAMQEQQHEKTMPSGEDSANARSAAAVSLSYLRLAAEKKKARDREFALELRREEGEYRKKIAQKIEQANKMIANTGGSKTFAAAPTREGAHMIRVSDPPKGDRIVSVEIFLREFEKLASVPLGQAPSSSATISATASHHASKSLSGTQPHQQSQLTVGKRPSSAVSRLRGRPLADADDPPAAERQPPTTAAKPADRSLVQEELKSVLAGTIALTKVLQDQLHELKLKGWNVSSRATY